MGFEVTLIERYKKMASLMDEADNNPEQGQEKLKEAAVIGCNALKDLAVDNPSSDFRQSVKLLTELRGQNSTGFAEITQTFGHFSSFLTIELRVIIAGGFPEYLANQIIQWCFDSYQELRTGGSDPASLLEKVKLFRDHACEVAEELKAKVQQEDDGQNTKRQLGVILKVMAGAALVGLNAAATVSSVATASITAAGAAVSGALGLALINNAKWPAKVKTAGGKA